ncbi:MAG: MiaE family protein [Planctomycetota bacterium]|jgi:tRNA-(ms[2]io[6]A)-hydroxylase
MLHLQSETDPTWAERAVENIDTVLLDHAHCEKKAASTAIGFVFRYPEHPQIAVPLSELAREELEHFELVVKILEGRGTPFRRLPPSEYAARLVDACRSGEPARLLDLFVVAALIEARSCERMQLLAERLDDMELKSLYEGLLESEARHHATYVDLARGTGLYGEDEIRERLEVLGRHEAAVLQELPMEPRFHNA